MSPCSDDGVGWADGRMKAVGLNTVRIQIGCKPLRCITGEEVDDSLVDYSPSKWRTILGRGISISQSCCRLGSNPRFKGEVPYTVSKADER